MNNLYHSIIVAALTALTINYGLARADTAEAPKKKGFDPHDYPVNMGALVTFEDKLKKEFRARPDFYDREDVNKLLQDSKAIYSTQFLNQRSGDWRKAYQLAAQTLKWRADIDLRHINAQIFPCDLFSLGLIFEHGHTHQCDDNGSGNPVIWIRLGALGSIVKQMEKYTYNRITSFAVSAAHSIARKTREFAFDSIDFEPSKEPSPVEKGIPERDQDNLSVKKERTVIHVLKSIAWWLEDWRNNHPPGTKAILVLDFEGADYVFSSTSTSDFFVKLDDRFPDFFEYIIGFRYKFNGKSLHSQVGWLNKIFSSRIKSSLETDRKLKFVNQEADIGAYMPRVNARGQSLLPAYISGGESLCMEASHTPPAGCQAELDTSNNLYDPKIWQAIHDEFNKVCKPQSRV